MTVGKSKGEKYLKKFSRKNIKKSIHQKYKKTKKLLLSPRISKKHTEKKEEQHLVPQPQFQSFQDLENSTVNKMNRSGYWGEHVIKEELKRQKFLLYNECKVENQYGDLDIIAYKKGRKTPMVHIEFHEIKTVTRGSAKENIDLRISSQMRHLLSEQQRKGGEVYVKEVLEEQVMLGNKYAKVLLGNMKTAYSVKYFLHKVVIDKKGREISGKRQIAAWHPVKKQSILWAWIKNIFKKNS